MTADELRIRDGSSDVCSADRGRHRDGIGATEIFGDASGVIDARGPFGDGREHRRKIDLLKRSAIAIAARDIADEQDHRRRILHRHVDADRGVRRSRSTGNESDAGRSEEHTSELQSLMRISYAVFCLKKKNKKKTEKKTNKNKHKEQTQT